MRKRRMHVGAPRRMQPHVAASAPTRPERHAARVTQNAIEFGRLLAVDAELRQRCGDEAAFKHEVSLWSETERRSRQQRIAGKPNQILHSLVRLDPLICAQSKCARVSLIGSTIHFGPCDEADTDGALASVPEPCPDAMRPHTQTAIAFGQLLAMEAALQQRCQNVASLNREVLAWKETERISGRQRPGSAAEIVLFLLNADSNVRTRYGCADIQMVGSAVHFGAQGGHELAAASPSTYKPPTKAKAAIPELHSVISFGQLLAADEALRQRCEEKEAFKREVAAWKEAELSNGRYRVGAPARILFKLVHMDLTTRSENGCAQVKILGSQISFGQKSSASSASTSSVREAEVQEDDDNSVVVSPAAHKQIFTKDDIVPPGQSIQREMVVKNLTNAACKLASCRFRFFDPSFSLHVKTPISAALPFSIKPGMEIVLQVQYAPRFHGVSQTMLKLQFKSAGKTFCISRNLEARCGDAQELQDLAPTSEYERLRFKFRPVVSPVQTKPTPAAPRPSADGRLKMPPSFVPKLFKITVLTGDAKEELQAGAELVESADAATAIAGYAQHMHCLLWAEEVQLEYDLRSFDLTGHDATVLAPSSFAGCLRLRVDGLAEKRPSVLKGDTVKVNLFGQDKCVHNGRAAHIDMEDVHLEFSAEFLKSYIPNTKVEVSFVLSRSALHVFHNGISSVQHLPRAKSLLFPEETDLHRIWQCPPRLQARSHSLDLFNRQLNPEQLSAVTSILDGVARRVPYVLFGPPGTGKTTTLIEVMMQCARGKRNAPKLRVLACAPTNTAADVMCARMVHMGLSPQELYRIVAFSRSRFEVPPAVVRYTNYDSAQEAFVDPELTQLLGKQVVVATLVTAGKLFSLHVPRGHFDLIIIDEAGQATEPEALAALSTLLGAKGQLVLGGDPQQLGPVIHSPLAKEYGLQKSWLERLMQRPVYQRDGSGRFNPLVLTKLVRNFRSHAQLLELPNELFYEDELLCCADPLLTHSCLNWDGLPTLGVPLLFHGIVGKDTREGNSPSWFNPDEVVQVCQYVRALLQPHSLGRGAQQLGPGDIGIISPYNKQVQRIKKRVDQMLAGIGAGRAGRGAASGQTQGQIKVGSTEMFQGQERRVIIVSTVRSSERYIESDVRHKLGFLSNPKRFNVAITRACALLIIVGNPAVLMLDPNWGALLKVCLNKGAYTGVPPPPDNERSEADSLAAAMRGLTIDGSEEVNCDEPSHALQQEGMEMPEFE